MATGRLSIRSQQKPSAGVATIQLDASKLQTITLRDHLLLGGGNYGEGSYLLLEL